MARDQVTMKLKNAPQLSAALRRASIATGKLPAALMNRAVFSIANRAWKRMPAVADATIRSELEEYKVPVYSYSRKGKLLGKGNARQAFFGDGETVPRLALLISARANPSSRFNQLTNSRYALAQSPWKGVPRAVGAQRMLAAMRKMFNARIKSRGFFRVCAGVVMFVFKRLVPAQAQAGARTPTAATGSISKRIGKIADGTPATGTGKATARFWVSGTSADGNAALYRIAQPVWQEALDHEGRQVTAYAAAQEYKKELRAAGFKVT